jgi:putative membrane protein
VGHLIIRFVVRWFVSSLGLWIAAGLLGGSLSYGGSLGVILVAGLMLAIINILIKPFLILVSLPAILLSLGLFMIVINGLTVYLTSKLYPSLHLSSFWVAIVAGMVIGLVNFLMTAIIG